MPCVGLPPASRSLWGFPSPPTAGVQMNNSQRGHLQIAPANNFASEHMLSPAFVHLGFKGENSLVRQGSLCGWVGSFPVKGEHLAWPCLLCLGCLQCGYVSQTALKPARLQDSALAPV